MRAPHARSLRSSADRGLLDGRAVGLLRAGVDLVERLERGDRAGELAGGGLVPGAVGRGGLRRWSAASRCRRGPERPWRLGAAGWEAVVGGGGADVSSLLAHPAAATRTTSGEGEEQQTRERGAGAVHRLDANERDRGAKCGITGRVDLLRARRMALEWAQWAHGCVAQGPAADRLADDPRPELPPDRRAHGRAQRRGRDGPRPQPRGRDHGRRGGARPRLAGRRRHRPRRRPGRAAVGRRARRVRGAGAVGAARRRRPRLRPGRGRGHRRAGRGAAPPARLRRARRLGPGSARGRDGGGVLDRRAGASARTSSPTTPRTLWSRVLRRKGREYALLATMPVDPSLN